MTIHKELRLNDLYNPELSLHDVVPLQLRAHGWRYADVAFRCFTLPANPAKRDRRIKEILTEGTDRTRRFAIQNFSEALRHKKLGILFKPKQYLFANHPYYFFQNPEVYISTLKANALLIYDTQGPYGIKNTSIVDSDWLYCFKKPSERTRALLGLIRLG